MLVLHTIRDALWEMGRGGQEPQARPWPAEETQDENGPEDEVANLAEGVKGVELEEPENMSVEKVPNEDAPPASISSPEGPSAPP